MLSAISIEFSPFIHEIACSRKSKIVQECIRFPWGTRKVLNNSHRILKLFCNVRYKFSKRNILNYDLLLSSLQLPQWFMIIFCSKKIFFYVNFIKLLQVTFNWWNKSTVCIKEPEWESSIFQEAYLSKRLWIALWKVDERFIEYEKNSISVHQL